MVFISYFVLVPLRKGHRDLEYQCSFVRLYLFLFAFSIICIETFCIFDYLYRDLLFRRFFYNITVGVCETGPQSDIQDDGLSEEQQRKIIYKRYSIQVWLNIHPNYNYLHKLIYTYT